MIFKKGGHIKTNLDRSMEQTGFYLNDCACHLPIGETIHFAKYFYDEGFPPIIKDLEEQTVNEGQYTMISDKDSVYVLNADGKKIMEWQHRKEYVDTNCNKKVN